MEKPIVSVTFDDGFGNVESEALPILAAYGVRATVFVVTGCIGTRTPMPFDRWSRRHHARVASDVWQPLSWAQVERCVRSGLVTLGSHSHRHLNGRECSPAEFADEAHASREILLRRFGHDHARAYAYPYGSRRLGFVPAAYVEAVRAAGYRLAVSTELGLVSPDSDPYLLPRVEVTASDSPAVLRAKTRGALAPFYLSDWLRTTRGRERAHAAGVGG